MGQRKGHPNQTRCQGKLTEMLTFKDQKGVDIGIPGRSYVTEGYVYMLKTYITSCRLGEPRKGFNLEDSGFQAGIFDKAIEELQSGG